MRSPLGRVFWWLVVYDRPTWVGDYIALLALVGLLLLGALALGWPWLAEAVPRALASGLAAAQAALGAGLELLRAAWPKLG